MSPPSRNPATSASTPVAAPPTPTPISDGTNIFVAYGNGLVTCFDATGNRQWIRFLDQDDSPAEGRSASPVLSGDKLIVSMGCVTALDAKTGNVIWTQTDALAGYGTPIAVKVGQIEVIVTPDGKILPAPEDGKILASDIGSHLSTPPPVFNDGVVCFIEASAQAVNLLPKNGNEVATRQVWRGLPRGGG